MCIPKLFRARLSTDIKDIRQRAELVTFLDIFVLACRLLKLFYTLPLSVSDDLLDAPAVHPRQPCVRIEGPDLLAVPHKR